MKSLILHFLLYISYSIIFYQQNINETICYAGYTVEIKYINLLYLKNFINNESHNNKNELDIKYKILNNNSFYKKHSSYWLDYSNKITNYSKLQGFNWDPNESILYLFLNSDRSFWVQENKPLKIRGRE